MTEHTAAPAQPRVPWKLLLIGTAVLAVAVFATVALWPGSERFDSAPALVARLQEAGAPCQDFRELDQASGVCKADGHTFVVAVVSDSDVQGQVREAQKMDDYAVAAGDGWYVGGDPGYVERVADLLGADFHP